MSQQCQQLHIHSHLLIHTVMHIAVTINRLFLVLCAPGVRGHMKGLATLPKVTRSL